MINQQMIIGSSFLFEPPTPPWPTAVDPGGGIEEIVGNAALGFWKRTYSYYFADNVPGLIGSTPVSSVGDTSFQISGNEFNNFSVQWTGYFQAPATAAYKFRTTSDDCSYFWIGTDSYANVSTSNADVNNGGLHGAVTVESATPLALTGGLYYPIRAMFGEQAGAETFYMEINQDNDTWVPFPMDYARYNSQNTTEGL